MFENSRIIEKQAQYIFFSIQLTYILLQFVSYVAKWSKQPRYVF